MEQTQLLNWEDESLTCETLEGKDGNQETVGRLHVFSSSYGPEKDFWIHCGENIIGRQTTCHIPIPASSISKRHAVIEAEVDGSHFIYDCDSLNRTRRQKSTLKPKARYALNDKDLLLFADVACQYFILPQPNENGTLKAGAAEHGLRGSPHARDTDSDDSLLVPGTQSGPAQPLAIEKTPAVKKMGYGGVLAKDSDDDSEESNRSRSRPRQGERASQESTVSAEGRLVPNSSAVMTPTSSTVVPESDTEEGQESTTGKDQPEPQPEQRPQDLFHLDSDTDVEDEDFSSKYSQRPFRKGGSSTSQNNDMEEKGTEQPAVGIEKCRMLSSGLDSDTDTDSGRTERSSLFLGDSSNTSSDQDSDTDVERERERRPGVGEGDSRHANADQDSDTDMEGEGIARSGAGEGDSRQVNTDQDSDTDEGIERPGGGEVRIRQVTAYQDSDTDMEGEETEKLSTGKEGIRQATADLDSDTDMEGEGTERLSTQKGDIRQASADLDSDIDMDGEGTERLSTQKGGIRQATADLTSDTDVEGEGTERLSTQKGGIRQATADLTSDTDVEGEGAERLSTGEGGLRKATADLNSDTDVEGEGTKRPSRGEGCIRQVTADLTSDTDMEGEGTKRPSTGEGCIRQITADLTSDTDVEGEGTKRLSTGGGCIRQITADLTTDTDVEGEGTTRPSTEEGCIRQITADLTSDTDVEGEGTERLSTGEGGLRKTTADLDTETDVEEEGAGRPGTGGESIGKSCAQQNSDTDVEGARSKRLMVEEEDIRQLSVHHDPDTDMEQGQGTDATDHSTPVEQRHSWRRPGPCDTKTESEEEADTDDGSSFAMLDTQCYLSPASNIWEEEREASIDTGEEATQIFTSKASSDLFKKPFVLRPSTGLLPTSECASSEKTDNWADDQLVVAETQPFCDNHDLSAISSKGRAENIEVEPTQAFLRQGESEEVSQEETQPIALYLSLRAASEPQRVHCGLDTMTVLQRQAVSENHAKANTTKPRSLPPLEKGEKPKICAQSSVLQLSVSEAQTQTHAIDIKEENVTESSLHPEGEIPKESKEMAIAFSDETQTCVLQLSVSEEQTQTYSIENVTESSLHLQGEIPKESKDMEIAFSDETQTCAVTLAEEEQEIGTLKVCREKGEPQEQETAKILSEAKQVSKDNTLPTQPLTASTISNHPCTEKLVDTLDGPDPERVWGEEKVSPKEARTCENTEKDSGNDATQEEVPLPPLIKGTDRTREEEEVKKEGRKKGRKEKKEEEKTTKATSDALEAGESDAVQLPEEGRSSTPGPVEEDKGGTPQEKKTHKKGGLPCGYQRKQSKVQEEPSSAPGNQGSTVDQAAESKNGNRKKTSVPSQVLEPRAKSTRSTRRKTGPITEVKEEEKETEQEHQPPAAPSRATKRTKKAVSESTANEAPAELEVPTLTRRTRARRGLVGTEEVPTKVTARPEHNRKSVVEKGAVKEEEKKPQNPECVREKNPLGTRETKEPTALERHQVGADFMDLPHADEEDKKARTGAITAPEKLPAAEEHTSAMSQETPGARGTRKRKPARPAQEDGSKPTQIVANIEPKRRRTRAAAAVAGVAGDDTANSQKSLSREASALPSSEESKVGRERTRRGSASSKASQETLDFAQTTPSRSSQRLRLTVAMSENDILSKRDRRSNSKDSSHGSSEKQDQDLATSSQESLVAGRRLRKQNTASSEDKAEDAEVVASQEGSTPRRTCRALGSSSSPAANREPAVPKVMFTGVIDEDGEQVVCKLGGELAESVYECTHLVTDRVRRTVKFLCALARGIPIVTLDWLKKCGRSGCFLCPSGFLVKDAEQEHNFSFSLSVSLQRARRGRLFEGYEIHVTPNVKPEPEYMKDIIQCSGATFLPNMPRTYKEKRIVISCPEDLAKCKPAFNATLPVANTEFMLTGILQQVIDLQAYALEAAADVQESTAKRTSKRGTLTLDTASATTTTTDTKSKRRR